MSPKILVSEPCNHESECFEFKNGYSIIGPQFWFRTGRHAFHLESPSESIETMCPDWVSCAFQQQRRRRWDLLMREAGWWWWRDDRSIYYAFARFFHLFHIASYFIIYEIWRFILNRIFRFVSFSCLFRLIYLNFMHSEQFMSFHIWIEIEISST